MITLSANVQSVLSNKDYDIFFIVRVYDSTQTHHAMTSFYRDIQMSDTITYLSDGKLAGVDPPRASTSVDREEFSILLADPNFLLGSFASVGYIGKEIDVRICFINPADGTPYTNLSDTILIYSGYGDGTGYKINTEEQGESLLKLMCSSPMADLDGKKGLYLSRDFVRGRNPDDSCCDHIYLGSGKIQLRWGKL